jgi:membrane-associated HD superfamily phosphohydrolase
MQNKKIMLLLIATIFIGVLSGCADLIQYQYSKEIQPVGFWYGLWHGMIMPLSFIISLFNDQVAIYAIYNNGGWYNFGFLLGLSMSIGGGSTASSRKAKFRK